MDLPDRVRGLAGGLDVNFSEESIEMVATALEFDPAKRPADVRAFAKPIVRDLESRS